MVPCWLVSSYLCDITVSAETAGHTIITYSVPLCRHLAVMMAKAQLSSLSEVLGPAYLVALFPVLLRRCLASLIFTFDSLVLIRVVIYIGFLLDKIQNHPLDRSQAWL